MADEAMPPQPKDITIFGAGIAGLTLARCLRQVGVRSTIYERDSAQAFAKRYNYGITLDGAVWRRLNKDHILHDESRFKELVRPIRRAGDDEGQDHSRELRANRNRFEQLLNDGLDVHWEHHLAHIQPASGAEHSNDWHLTFRNGATVRSSLVVGADGPHSVVRSVVSPDAGFEVHPYAVYNGRRRVSRALFDSKFVPNLGPGETVAEHRSGDVLLKLSVDDVPSEPDKDVSISYTFSRAATSGDGDGDALYRPRRAKEEAKQIPGELFATVAGMQGGLPEPFRSVFDADAMGRDRLLNWLMRSMLVSREDLDRGAAKGLLLIGDCAHGTPILGGDGAKQAILDGMELADILARPGRDGLQHFYARRYASWEDSLESSKRRLASAHGVAEDPAERL